MFRLLLVVVERDKLRRERERGRLRARSLFIGLAGDRGGPHTRKKNSKKMIAAAAQSAAGVVVSASRTATTSRTTHVSSSCVSLRSRAAARRGDAVTATAFTPAGAKIAGVGMSIPEQYLTNDDLSKLVETNDEWIKTRTGIGKRHVISGDETLTSLAADASTKALEMAGVKAEDLDLIILATSSPDDIFGSACTVRTKKNQKTKNKTIPPITEKANTTQKK